MREIQADIPIMIHLDNGGFNEMYVEWFDEFTKRAEPFDIIGLSYYPFWHGTMEDYRDREGKTLDQLKGMATKPELVEKLNYPMTKEGQASFMGSLHGFRFQDVVGRQKQHLHILEKKDREEMSGRIRRCSIMMEMPCLHLL